MLIDRTFIRRGKEMHVREVSDLVAVKQTQQAAHDQATSSIASVVKPDDEGSKVASSKLERLPSQFLDAVAPEVPLSQVRAFEDAGWQFVPVTNAVENPKDATTAKVFVKP